MATQIDKDAVAILEILANAPRDQHLKGEEIAGQAELDPGRVNDAVAILVHSGWVEWIRWMGTAPFDFGQVTITSRGRYEAQRLASITEEPTPRAQPPAVRLPDNRTSTLLPPSPVGSPFGFTDEHWEIVAERKSHQDMLYTVLGHQFSSEFFETSRLRDNVEAMLEHAVNAHNKDTRGPTVTLEHKGLVAGYGEHLFNEIARDIIGADIALFETSDLNPNVMLEMGVALTWGCRVLPIKLEGRSKPPSDVSGQTWADYRDSAAEFVDSDHEVKLIGMIRQAVRKKGR